MARMKRATKRTIAITVTLAIILVAAFTAFYIISTKQIKSQYEEELEISQKALADNTKQIYLAAHDIKLGSTITASDIMTVSAVVSLEDTQFFSSVDLGSVALVNVPAGTLLTTSMISYEAPEDTLRQTEFDVIVLNSNMTNGDFADIRIRFPNGEDMVVLSKKMIDNISLRNAICYMDLNEEETQLISSAIVDASLYGAILYTTAYIEPSIQEASVVTYQPSMDVLKVMLDNPNILEIAHKNLSALAREEMEKRLMAYEDMLKNDGRAPEQAGNVSDIPSVDNAGNMQNDYIEDTEMVE